jgi:predicted dehydrogenase
VALRLGLVGCGKVTERFHLPAALACPEVRLAALVDPDLRRAEALAGLADGASAHQDIGALAGRIDAAVVAAPHHLHADITCALLGQGIHVLVEKPMALDAASCDRMIAAAERHGATLAVGLVRRWYDASRWVKASLDAGDFGSVVSVDVREGAVFSWQVVSDATFRRAKGGGVLADIGVHVLDLLAWWLGDPTVVAYRDDAMGGVEAECEIELAFPGGASGVVELSRTRTLRNDVVIRFERATLRVGPGVDSDLRLEHDGRSRVLSGHAHAPGSERLARLEPLFEAQLRDLAAAVQDGRPPFVTGRDGRRSIALLEACRAARAPLELPWLRPPRRPRADGMEPRP